MKQAKRYPFLIQQQRRFHLHFDNHHAGFTTAPLPPQRDFYHWAWHALKTHYRRANLSLVLLNETEARAYNRDYRGKDYATNVLSFPLNVNANDMLFGQPADTLQGDLIMCPQVIFKEAVEQAKTPTAHFAHLTLHGVLHLMGYDHQHQDEAEMMEALEIRLLNQLGYPNPYLQDEI